MKHTQNLSRMNKIKQQGLVKHANKPGLRKWLD